MSIPQLNVGLAGYGTVGSGVVHLLQENQNELVSRLGCRIVVTKVADRDMPKLEAAGFGPEVTITPNLDDLVNDPSVDVVLELMGGIEAAKKLFVAALGKGKQVVTANKALLAHTGSELFNLAQANNTSIRYEASVAGGIPVIQTLRESLVGNKISSIIGILNGTGNFILSAMSSTGASFEDALAEAQEKGYAEADPTLDIDGHDTAHKLILLIRLAWGMEYPYEQLPVCGIRSVHSMDISFAREFGYRIKLLGQAHLRDGKLEACVHPTLVNHTYLIARVGGAYNAVRIEGNGVGSLFLHGLGAGSLPTASAVVADLAAAAQAKMAGTPPVARQRTVPLALANEVPSPWYLRFSVRDVPGVLRDLSGALAQEGISIAQVIQRGEMCGGVPLVIKTHNATAPAIGTAIKTMQAHNLLLADPVYFKILE
jgi:Homoserine dehydrogenase